MLATRAYNKGFTLIEVLLSVTVLVLTLGWLQIQNLLLLQLSMVVVREVSE
jgi:prepilin-type N-terminal cleavage/methylation domain-containing protein